MPCAYIASLFEERLGDLVGDEHRADRRVADESPLAHVIRSGLMSYFSLANQAPSAAEAGDHLVGAEQDPVAVADLAHALEVAGRRRERTRRRSAPAP
jgi:hypothetical protein